MICMMRRVARLSVPVGIIGQMSDGVCMYALRAHVWCGVLRDLLLVVLSHLLWFSLFSLTSIAAASVAARRDMITYYQYDNH